LVETFVNSDERLQARGKNGEDHLRESTPALFALGRFGQGC
jgi:hypothetical protein